MRPLAGLPVLLLDAQATGGGPARGPLLEIGWARGSAGEARELPAADVTAHVVAPPSGAVVPPAVARLTGLRTAEWARGIAPAVAWERLLRAAERVAPPPGPVPVVIHFALFEEPFLRALHECHGAGPFPLDFVCTHAIACRLLAELPRRTLRALASAVPYVGKAASLRQRVSGHFHARANQGERTLEMLTQARDVSCS